MEKAPSKPRKRWDVPEYTSEGRKPGQVSVFDKTDVRAIQALFAYAKGAETPWPPGEEPPPPSPHDVKRALDWIIEIAAATYNNGFAANDPNGRIAAFMDGRAFVGQQIIRLGQMHPALFNK
jgi:hypothetical protein